VRHNVSPEIIKNKTVENFFIDKIFLKKMIRYIAPNKMQEKLRKINRIKPKISPREREKLIEFYKPDILRLQQLIDKDLSLWLN
jgi:hypothetical protein